MSLDPKQFDKLFFPDSGRSIKKARTFCGDCPVRDDCLEFALDNDCVGVWAGTNYEERKGIINFRNMALTFAPVAAATVIRVESPELKTPLTVSKSPKSKPTHKKVVGKRKKQKRKTKPLRSNFRAVE